MIVLHSGCNCELSPVYTSGDGPIVCFSIKSDTIHAGAVRFRIFQGPNDVPENRSRKQADLIYGGCAGWAVNLYPSISATKGFMDLVWEHLASQTEGQ